MVPEVNFDSQLRLVDLDTLKAKTFKVMYCAHFRWHDPRKVMYCAQIYQSDPRKVMYCAHFYWPHPLKVVYCSHISVSQTPQSHVLCALLPAQTAMYCTHFCWRDLFKVMSCAHFYWPDPVK